MKLGMVLVMTEAAQIAQAATSSFLYFSFRLEHLVSFRINLYIFTMHKIKSNVSSSMQ